MRAPTITSPSRSILKRCLLGFGRCCAALQATPRASSLTDRSASELALGVACRAAQQRPNPSKHLFKMERLGDVIVGARIKALHLVAPAIARGKDQDGHRAASAAPSFEHRNTVHFR